VKVATFLSYKAIFSLNNYLVINIMNCTVSFALNSDMTRYIFHTSKCHEAFS